MLARLLWGVGVGELLLYGGLGWYLLGGWSVPLAVLLGFLGLRFVIVLAMFAIAARYHSPRPALPASGWLRLLIGEYRALLACYLWLHPLAPWRARSVWGPWPSPYPPVILIHGFFCNAGYWRPLQAYLAGRGVRTYTLDLAPVFGSIDDYARQLGERVEAVCRESGAPRVVLVGHSMGGLVARVYLGDSRHAARVARLLTLGSPHRGTVLARLARGQNLLQMRLLSPWLDGLKRAATPLVPVVSLYSHHDNIVIPQDSSVLDGADNQAYCAIGHMALGLSPRIHQRLYQEITGSPAPPRHGERCRGDR